MSRNQKNEEDHAKEIVEIMKANANVLEVWAKA
jgi:hypothetical protein